VIHNEWLLDLLDNWLLNHDWLLNCSDDWCLLNHGSHRLLYSYRLRHRLRDSNGCLRILGPSVRNWRSIGHWCCARNWLRILNWSSTHRAREFLPADNAVMIAIDSIEHVFEFTICVRAVEQVKIDRIVSP